MLCHPLSLTVGVAHEDKPVFAANDVQRTGTTSQPPPPLAYSIGRFGLNVVVYRQ
jgi:hypothetical protein